MSEEAGTSRYDGGGLAWENSNKEYYFIISLPTTY